MFRTLLFASLLIITSEARRCYSCTSAADCLSVGVGRVQECDSRTQCYTVSINGRPQLKGCTASCAVIDRHSELHLCHTCEGDLCNSYPLNVNNQDHHHRRHNRREARRHNDNKNIGSGASVGGGIGSGANPNNHGSSHSNYGSGIGNGASMGGSGGSIGSGASVGGNGGIGGGVAPRGSNSKHYKRHIGHGAELNTAIGGGAAPVGGGAYPQGNWHSPAGGIGGGAVPGSDPYQRNDNQWNEQQAGYNGIGGGARPVGGSSASLFSLAAIAAPLALFAFRG